MWNWSVCLLLIASVASSQVVDARGVVHGSITLDWKRPADLTSEFLSSNTKPIMMVVHKSWCAACKELMADMVSSPWSEELMHMSRNFVMVNALDSQEPHDPSFAPDGSYVPRIVFMESSGKVQPEFTCKLKENKDHLYFYASAEQVTHSMQSVLSKHGDSRASD